MLAVGPLGPQYCGTLFLHLLLLHSHCQVVLCLVLDGAVGEYLLHPLHVLHVTGGHCCGGGEEGHHHQNY